MSAADVMRVRLARLLYEIGLDRAAFHKKLVELAAYRAALDAPTPGRPVLALVAMDLHDAYTALEAVFERVARAIDGDVPSGVDSHRALLDQMATAIPSVREPVLDVDTTGTLHDLRRFRHFFRHAYAVELDPAKLMGHVDALHAIAGRLDAALDRFVESVRRMYEPGAPIE